VLSLFGLCVFVFSLCVCACVCRGLFRCGGGRVSGVFRVCVCVCVCMCVCVCVCVCVCEMLLQAIPKLVLRP
jgi:hypothetical protein